MSVNMAKGFCLQLLWSRGKSFWLQGGRESMLIAERTCCCGTRSNYKTKAEGAKAEKAAKPIRETQTQIDHRIPPQKTKMTTPQIGISKLLSDSTTPNLSWYKSLHIPPFSTLPHHMPPWQIVQCCVAAREGISQGKELGCIEGIGEKRCSHWHLQCKKIVSKAWQRVGTCPTCRKSHPVASTPSLNSRTCLSLRCLISESVKRTHEKTEKQLKIVISSHLGQVANHPRIRETIDNLEAAWQLLVQRTSVPHCLSWHGTLINSLLV